MKRSIFNLLSCRSCLSTFKITIQILLLKVIIEGSDAAGGPWKEYDFMYKPGNISQSPPGMYGHQGKKKVYIFSIDRFRHFFF